jgi:hypothetical protein
MTEYETTFEGYSYRTSCRFGNRVNLSVDGGIVTVTGPRVGVLTYRLWIAVQVVLFWLIVPALLAAVILWDWRYLLLALVVAVAYWAFSGLGAVILWAWADVSAIGSESDPTVSFPVSTAKRVKIGHGWARNSLWLVIPLFVPGINKWSEGRTVSFEAPDGETGSDRAVYAIFMRSERDAAALAALLGGRVVPV